MVSCKQIDLLSANKETETSVLNTIKVLEAKQQEEAALKKAEEFKKIIERINTTTGSDKEAVISFKKDLGERYQPAIEFISELKTRAVNSDTSISDRAANIANRMLSQGIDEAKTIKKAWKDKFDPEVKVKRKSKQTALREICEAGAEYSRDGYGTQAQIAHELAYWVIDLYKQTGGAASEGQLRNAGAHGYMYENCSKY